MNLLFVNNDYQNIIIDYEIDVFTHSSTFNVVWFNMV